MNAPAMLNTSGRMSKPIAAVWQQDYTTGRRIEMMRGFFCWNAASGDTIYGRFGSKG